MKAHLDFETRSTTDLMKSGVYRYAEDHNTSAWCFSWRIGNSGPVNRWRPGDEDPHELLNFIILGGVVVAHNAAFERRIWNVVIRRDPRQSHWPELLAQGQDCTMARAAAVAHPQKLETLCKALHTSANKDMEGNALMKKMAKPKGFKPDGTVAWHDEEANVQRLMSYCDQDIFSESEADDKLPDLTEGQRETWLLDQRINDRGIPIDLPSVRACVSLVEHAKKAADKEMRALTRRTVPKCSNDAKLVGWVNSRGVEVESVKVGEHDHILLMADILGDATLREVIELRKASKKTSTAKYASMLKCVCADGRIRGMLNYHGASTGRWAGRLVQPQNLPRVDFDKEGAVMEWLHTILLTHSTKEVYDLITHAQGDASVLPLLSRALRSMIKAEPGHQFIGGDFANIEGRFNAWLAGESWKLEAFLAYDNGVGPDLYKLAYARSFNVRPEDVDGGMRQVGKVQELALGYQGSIGAYLGMADNYGVTPFTLSGPVYEATPSHLWDLTAATYSKAKDKFGLREKEWTAIKVLVNGWRETNPAIVQSWWDYQDAAIQAVDQPFTAVACALGKVHYYSDRKSLWCVLPSGRMLCYAEPRLEQEAIEYVDKHGETKTRTKRKVTFWGVNSTTRQWSKNSLYGGMQCENVCQAGSGDIMVDRMHDAEARGYPIVLTVHDELVAMTPLSAPHLNSNDFEKLMSEGPSWAEGLPLAAKAWEHERYVK